MAQVYVYRHGPTYEDVVKSAVCYVEASTEQDLKVKLRGHLLANLDDIVNQIAEGRFSLQRITDLGQRVDPKVFAMMQSLPEGFALIRHMYQTRPMEYKTVYYQAPEGIVVDSKTIRRGEFHDAWDCHGDHPPWAKTCVKL